MISINKIFFKRFYLYLVVLSSLSIISAHSAPEGGNITHGLGSINVLENETSINQVSDNLIIDWNSFNDLADKLQSEGIKFIVEPNVRFKDLPGEQATMFFEDYSGNAIELKAYRKPSEVFSK